MALLVGTSEICAACCREIPAGQACVTTFMQCRTRGISPRALSPAQTVYMCQPCAISRISAAAPEGPYNLAVYVMMRDLFQTDPSLGALALEQMNRQWTPDMREAMLRRMTTPPVALPEGEVLPPPRALKAAG